MKRILTSVVTAAWLAMSLGAMGCVEDSQCEQACQRVCDDCGSGCGDLEVENCTNGCIDGESDPERVKCLLEAACEDLWTC